ncbi:MAG: hypothetical protein R3320_09295 [Nitriliruptorales bacterium]|nr:hypothetical protein [Nitriliruptorales bacterium]
MDPARSPYPDRGEPRELSARARRLVDEAQATDRGERFRLRLERVVTSRDQRRRRRRAASAVSLVLLALTGIAIGAVLGGLAGAVIGMGSVALVWGLRHTLRLLAPRRGASAWDWRAQRYRLMGDPSKAVQERDRPQE